MKYFLIVLMLFSFDCLADDWADADTNREAVYLVLHAMDWAQTRNIARNPDQYFEYNPIIGRHPSIGRVDGYMFTSALLHVGVTHILPTKYRPAWQYITIGFKVGLVNHNFSVGLGAKF